MTLTGTGSSLGSRMAQRLVGLSGYGEICLFWLWVWVKVLAISSRLMSGVFPFTS